MGNYYYQIVGFIWVVLKNLGNKGKSQQLQAASTASTTEATKELFVD
jgi:hypothetical protein